MANPVGNYSSTGNASTGNSGAVYNTANSGTANKERKYSVLPKEIGLLATIALLAIIALFDIVEA